MSKALIAGINQVAADKGLDREVIFEAIEAALVSAYKRNYGSISNVTAAVDRVSGDMHVYAEREVVEDVFNERTEIAEEDAKKSHPEAKLGDVIDVETTPDNFGRIAAQTAKQVILQRIREAERDTVYENFAHRVGELINSQVRSVDSLSGAVTVLLEDRHEVLMMRDEQIPGERLRRGDFVKLYVVDVHRSTRGPVIKLSRTHRNLLRRLMEQEIPEVRDGVVEIKAIAREPGARSKVAVVATQPNVDAVGSCVGLRGLRIQNIVTELANEKIDVVEWSTDLQTYIANALSPAKVNNVILDESGNIKTAIVVVPDRQLSLAIGKEGQNARLAAKLTGWRIDIKSESEAMDEGLDRLSQAQAQALSAAPADDILARAERFLNQEDESSESAEPAMDALSLAAAALEESDTQEIQTEELSVPSFDDVLAQTETVESAPAELPELPEFEDLMEMPALPDEEAAFEEDVKEPEPEPAAELADAPAETEEAEETLENEAAGMLTGADLPEVITADMLRERMAQRKSADFDSADFEIPAELLAGLDDEEEDEDWEFEAKSKRSKSPTKPAKSAKKGKKKKKPRNYEDEYDSF